MPLNPNSQSGKTDRDAPRDATTATIRAEIEANTCTAVGITVRSSTPVLTLCRRALAAGLDPNQSMEVWRGATLALRVRSIGEAAGLEIRGDGVGFRPACRLGTAPPVRCGQKNDAPPIPEKLNGGREP